MKPQVLILTAVLLGSATLMPADAAGPAAKTVVRGLCMAKGDGFVYCSTSGDVHNPKKLLVRVESRPNQRAETDWSVSCTKGTRFGSRSGSFTEKTPYSKNVPLPFTAPEECSFSLSFYIEDAGTVKGRVLANVG